MQSQDTIREVEGFRASGTTPTRFRKEVRTLGQNLERLVEVVRESWI